MNSQAMNVRHDPLEFRRIERAIGFIAEQFREQPTLEQVAAAAG